MKADASTVKAVKTAYEHLIRKDHKTEFFDIYCIRVIVKYRKLYFMITLSIILFTEAHLNKMLRNDNFDNG